MLTLPKFALLLILSCFLCCKCGAQAELPETVAVNVWVTGSNSLNQAGVYGNKGEASATFSPAARSRAGSWYDSVRKEFWLFGGEGIDYYGNVSGVLNDLWVYRLDDNTWTWLSGDVIINQAGKYGEKGKANATNVPGSRHSVTTWYDSSTRELWLFGGYGYAATGENGHLNDLWRYQVSDNTWTWISGNDSTNQKGSYGEKGNASADNMPGSRYGAVGWYDTSTKEIWLFGGYGYASTSLVDSLNDLWRYNVNNDTWTWVSGSSDTNAKAKYGSKGITNSTNVPGARYGAVGGYDETKREFWMFGGMGNTETGNGYLADLWKYSTNDDAWTWMAGATVANYAGYYGEKGYPGAFYSPGSRSNAIGWFDSANQEFYLYGGSGYTDTTSFGRQSDLWKYTVSSDEWTWISGSKRVNQAAVYGQKGVANKNNMPGARFAPAGFLDTEALELWAFGGYGYNELGGLGFLNDGWRISIQETCLPLYQLINKSCYSVLNCSTPQNCTLKCVLDEPICHFNGDILLTNSPDTFKVITVESAINATGNFTIAGKVTVILSEGATLNVSDCLIMDMDAEMVVEVGRFSWPAPLTIATYNAACSSLPLSERVKIETLPSLSECLLTSPTLTQREEGGRAFLEVSFEPCPSESEPSEVNVLVIAIVVPIAAIVVLSIVIMFAVEPIRKDILSLCMVREAK